jgi:hypothetical protein
VCAHEVSCVFNNPCPDHGRDLAPTRTDLIYARLRARIEPALIPYDAQPVKVALSDTGTCSDALVLQAAVPATAETVAIITRQSGGKPANVHLAALHAIAQPPRKLSYKGGRWFRRPAGALLCSPFPSMHQGTVIKPAAAAPTCPVCLGIAAQRGIVITAGRSTAQPRLAVPGTGHGSVHRARAGRSTVSKARAA